MSETQGTDSGANRTDEEVLLSADATVSPDAKVTVSPELFESIKEIVDDPNTPDVVKFSARLSGAAARLAEQYGPYTFIGNVGRINDIDDEEYEVEAFPAIIGSAFDAPYLIGHLLGQEILEDIATAKANAQESGDPEVDLNEVAEAAVLLAAQRFASVFCVAAASNPMILSTFRDALDTVIDNVIMNKGVDLPQ